MPKLGAMLFMFLTAVLTVISVELFFIAKAARDISQALNAPIAAPAAAPAMTEAEYREQLKRDVQRSTDRVKWLLNELGDDAERRRPTRQPQEQTDQSR